MNDNGADALARKRALQLILIAAVVQGWSLYGLSWCVDHNASIAKSSGLLIALYAFFTVAPLTLQFLVEHHSRRLAWHFALGVGLCFAGLGWHFGHNVANQPTTGFFSHQHAQEHVSTAIVLWLLVMPLLQTRLITGRWLPHYATLFAQGWRNVLTVLEATLFTAVFWGLLWLCDALFRMLGVTFFGELYREDVFDIPVTWLTFGVSLYLIGGLDQLTTVTLRQILGVLKWLAVPAVFIVAFFSVALLLSLPGLVGGGQRRINASTLLWIVALVALFLNAAYRDGETEQPYPRAIGIALRVLIPLTLVIALTATWNLVVRTRLYGLTVDRTWGLVVAGTAIALTAGYSLCAIRKDRWMRGMDRVNEVVIVALIAVITLALTPALSPYRLAANSQDRVIRAGQHTGRPAYVQWRNDIINELRFDAGEYGMAKLRLLAADTGLPKDVAERATTVLAKDFNRFNTAPSDLGPALARLPIYPKGRTLQAELASVVDASTRAVPYLRSLNDSEETLGVFLDLNGDGVEDFAFLSGRNGLLFEQVAGAWRLTADLHLRNSNCATKNLRGALEADQFGPRPPPVADLVIGENRFDVQPTGPCPKSN